MSVGFPVALLAIALLVPLIAILRRSAGRTRAAADIFHGQAPARAWFNARLLLACLFLASIVVVAARPQVALGRSADFVFLIDVSRSMSARHSCSEATFLERAKNVVRATTAAIPEARVGIFAFDRFAFPVSQLTADRDYIDAVLEHGVHVGLMLEATQTEIANALAVVAAKKKRLPDIYGNVGHVVLLSDGHVSGSFERRLQAPLAELRGQGIRVSAVGVGNPVATPITDTEQGECSNQLVEVDSSTVLIPLRADILKHIATGSGGGYYSESQTRELVAALRSELRDAPAAGVAGDRPSRDISGVFLVVATAALFGYLYLPLQMSTRRRSGASQDAATG